MRTRGFTLVEVLVAMMIMAILAVMAWQGVDGIVRTRTVSQARLEQTLRLNTVLGQIEQDVQSIQDTRAVDAITFDGATLRLTRRAETGVQVITWSLRPKPDATGNNWQRWAGPPARTINELQELWMRTFQFQGVEPGQLNTLSGITQWQVYCYRGNSWSNCQSTGNITTTVGTSGTPPATTAGTPPGTTTGTPPGTTPGTGQVPTSPTPIARQAPPSGLRIVLEFAGADLNGTLTRDIALGPL
jgi:general secretion pathway protein J